MHAEHPILHLGEIFIKLKQKKRKIPFHLILDLNMIYVSRCGLYPAENLWSDFGLERWFLSSVLASQWNATFVFRTSFLHPVCCNR